MRPNWAVALALVALGGCGRNQAEPIGKAQDRGGVERVEADARLVGAVAASTSQLTLQLGANQAQRQPGGSTSLSVQAGGVILFTESELTRGQSATVRVDVRNSAGAKTALVDAALLPGQELRYQAQEPGYTSIHRCTRPASLHDHPNAWQLADLCEITHVHVQDPTRNSALRDRHLTTKIGLPIELRPYRSTATLAPGEELPVRLYQKGIPMPNARLTASNEAGRVIEAQTNHKGVATFAIDRPGRWVVAGQLPDEALPDGQATVRLIFEVAQP